MKIHLNHSHRQIIATFAQPVQGPRKKIVKTEAYIEARATRVPGHRPSGNFSL